MKSNSLTSILLGVLAISALASMILYGMWATAIREHRMLQAQVVSTQSNRAWAARLATELLEYSKTNPAIDPLLEGFGIKQKPGAATLSPVKPSAK